MKAETDLKQAFSEVMDAIEASGNCLPDFSTAESIFCFSDYAGDRTSDNHHVYSFLFFDYKASGAFKNETELLRAKENAWNHHSFIEYKKIPSDKVRARILPDFLKAADLLRGLLIVVYVEKEVGSLFDPEDGNLADLVEKDGLGAWKGHIVEKLFQVLFFQVSIASRLLKEQHKYFWYSDRDAINDEGRERFQHVGALLGKFLDAFNVKCQLSGYATNLEDDSPDNYFGDVLAITDLAAGATLEHFEESFGPDKVKLTSDQILKWFAQPSASLQKIQIRLRKEGEALKFSQITYHLK